MRPAIDLSQQRFGRLLVLTRSGTSDGGCAMWKCRCDCGAEKIAVSSELRRGHTRSCGCLLGDSNRANKTKHGHAPKGRISPEFRAWGHMKERCYSPKHVSYPNYGARGIQVCDRWLHGADGKSGFECFFADMGRKPSPSLSVDRADNNGDYEPGNCRWATDKQQQRNTRRNRRVTIGGRSASFAEHCERYGISDAAVRSRLSLGWDVEAAFSTPTRSWVQRNERKNAKKERAS